VVAFATVNFHLPVFSSKTHGAAMWGSLNHWSLPLAKVWNVAFFNSNISEIRVVQTSECDLFWKYKCVNIWNASSLSERRQLELDSGEHWKSWDFVVSILDTVLRFWVPQIWVLGSQNLGVVKFTKWTTCMVNIIKNLSNQEFVKSWGQEKDSITQL